MKSSSLKLGTLLTVVSLILAACGGAATPTTAPATQAPQATTETQATTAPTAEPMTETTLKIGFTTSQTGSLNVEVDPPGQRLETVDGPGEQRRRPASRELDSEVRGRFL